MFGVLAEYLFVDERVTILSVAGGFIFAMIMVRFVLADSGLKNAVQPQLIRRI